MAHGLHPYTDEVTGTRKVRVIGPHGTYDVIDSLTRPGWHEVWRIGGDQQAPAERLPNRVDALEKAGDLAGLEI